jgi:hypothetical protein
MLREPIVLCLLLLAAPAWAQTSVAAEPTRIWGVRPLVIMLNKDLPLQVGAAADVTIPRGRFAPRVGASFAVTPSGGHGGHIRVEGDLDLLLGPLYLGVGGAVGTLALETPGVGSGAWSGAALALPGHAGARVGVVGSTAVTLELRAGHTVPIGSIDPTEEVPDEAARFELTLSAGMAF